ncbi:hypothetical protein PI126_g20317 [Phytophthora idaei]|nr:hypothetical protein PI126_g20317 [Phytophthora idaei]
MTANNLPMLIGKRNARTLAVTLGFHAVANLAGELLLVDATEAKILQFMRTVTRPDRCYLAGVVATAETVVVVYSDGALAWLQIDTWELLTTGMLPGGLTGSSVTVMTNFAKAHVGTRNSKIFEIRTTVLQDDEEDAENEEEESNTHRSAQSNRGNDESALVAPYASCPTGPACGSTVFTPCGGTFSTDALTATGGLNGYGVFEIVVKLQRSTSLRCSLKIQPQLELQWIRTLDQEAVQLISIRNLLRFPLLWSLQRWRRDLEIP